MEEENDKLYCHHCNSLKLIAEKRFGAREALTQALLTGGVGLLDGIFGSGNVKITCFKCGHKCNAGKLLDEEKKLEKNLKMSRKNFLI